MARRIIVPEFQPNEVTHVLDVLHDLGVKATGGGTADHEAWVLIEAPDVDTAIEMLASVGITAHAG